ncbi:hypothetical protein IAQ61_001496 [Plenodomus lingam]|uniref:Phosphatidylethanolamine-binding protein n=1 Tax=Leptosphaeria maculans (strain JN3 / isolate v23.1.3 / race Av1-4-5-6-7-8) TaxID=985895 RepID=E4ZY77_LEPMJ|nr:hypothetical protein LEMA_P112410.1 [Plenodomus lingam JN3]KAH9879677.1 hypothetical protein IAQ61_001496 [Plenodomus lingam]CBX96322.1 hypothetical protein LEMA_P112410.1 [Plenodomus lingam JN3]
MATTTLTALLASLKSANLLPSPIIPDTFCPTYNLTVRFPNLTPQNGDLARVSQVKEQPLITLSPLSATPAAAGNETSFTFMQIDPDAPTPDDPKYSYWRHWIVSNIPGSAAEEETGADVIAKGRTVTPYLAPGPKDDSGPHRYLFLLFKECGGKGLEVGDVGGEEFVDRRSFRAERVVQEKGMELVGVQWMRGVGDGWVGETGQ